MLPSPEQITKIKELTAKSIAGTLTLEEMREAVILMRQGRRAAAETSKKKPGGKAKGPVKSATELLAELEGLK